MKTTRYSLLLAVLTVVLALCPMTGGSPVAQAATGQAALVPTFSSVGIYWSPAGGSTSSTAAVSYREVGSASWAPGTDLWFDSRALAGRPPEYRGSIVGLDAGTAYEVRLQLAGASLVQQVRTWSEDFPIARVVELPARSTTPVDLREIGSPNGYVLVTGPGGGPATIDVAGRGDYGLRLTGSAYVVVRGLIVLGARHHGIQLGRDAKDDVHDVVLECNDIRGWGTPDSSGFGTAMDSAIYSDSASLNRVVIQGNRIGAPATTSNSWAQSHNGSRHPAGPQGISLRRSLGNNVVRYNDIVGDANHHFNDGMGATANFGYSGFPGRDSDVYGNYIAFTWDDGIEAEGGGMNVRIHDNYLSEVYHAFGMSAVSLGPLYAFRNVQDVARGDASATYGQAMFKMGGSRSGGTWYGDGRTYLFHNTALQPRSGPQNRKAVEAGDGRVLRNVISRNNIWRTGAPSGSYSISDDSRSPSNSFDHDLYNGLVRAAAGAEAHGVRAEPVHSPGWGMDAATRVGRFDLAAGSPGVDVGVPLPGFTDGWTGRAPDAGAQETGTRALTYGARAFRPGAQATTPTPTPRPTPSSTPSPRPGTRTITMTAVADTMVKQVDRRSAFGDGPSLTTDSQDQARANTAVHAYLRFEVAGLAPGERVVAATLRLRTVRGFGGTNDGPAVFRTADAASAQAVETMTWGSGRPARQDGAVGNIGAAKNDAVISTPISGITGNGLVSLELTSQSPDGMVVSSREVSTVASRPTLVLSVTSG